MKLIHHKRLERIRKRINVVDPSAPTEHIVNLDNEACEGDQCEDEQSSWDHSLRECSRRRSNRSENHGHAERDEECDEKKEEKGAGFSAEVGHEVQCEVVREGVEDLVGHVAEH